MDEERRTLRTTLRDVADENFAIEVLNSIKYNVVIKRVVSVEIVRGFVSSAQICNVDFDVPVTFLCPSLGVCLCYSILFYFLSEVICVCMCIYFCVVLFWGNPTKAL